MTAEQVEEKSGIRFTDEQREELQLHSFMKEERDFLLALMRDKKKLAACKAVCQIN